MSLKVTIDKEIKSAMLNKNKLRLTALRAIKSSILIEEKNKNGENKLNKEKEMQLLMKNIKQRKESMDLYLQQQRNDLAQIEKQEIDVISEFLPQQLSEEEIVREIEIIIETHKANDIKDMGKVMGIASKKFAGKADNNIVAKIVKSKLI